MAQQLLPAVECGSRIQLGHSKTTMFTALLEHRHDIAGDEGWVSEKNLEGRYIITIIIQIFPLQKK
jgi:hypothetical protein